MDVLKIVTTIFIVLLMGIFITFFKGASWEKDKASIIGFGFTELVYAFSLICIWL